MKIVAVELNCDDTYCRDCDYIGDTGDCLLFGGLLNISRHIGSGCRELRGEKCLAAEKTATYLRGGLEL